MVAASKVPMLKPGEYEIWRMRIKQYIQMIDYALWEVMENGKTLPITKVMEGVMIEMPITTAKEKAQRRLDVKARSTLMMGVGLSARVKSSRDEESLDEDVSKQGRRINAIDTDEDITLAVYKELGDSLVRTATTASRLEAKQDS
nr:DUF4219 domain-containing protein [Tanacetum cinerariifolium]